MKVILHSESRVVPATRRRVLLAGCLAHIFHDGMTDMLYVFFPLWQHAFRLSFAAVGLFKTLFFRVNGNLSDTFRDAGGQNRY